MGKPLAGFQIPPWRTGSDFWDSTALSEDVLSDYFEQEDLLPCVVTSERSDTWRLYLRPPAPALAAFVTYPIILPIPPHGGHTVGSNVSGGSTTGNVVSGGVTAPGSPTVVIPGASWD